MKVEIIKIGMLSENLFNAEFYDESGFFMAKDELNNVSLLLVNKPHNLVTFICQEEGIPNLKLVEEKTTEGVSEDLFLKSLSLLVNKDESYKQ